MKKLYQSFGLILLFYFSIVIGLSAQPVDATFTTDGLYVVPAGYTAIVTIEAWGGGGGSQNGAGPNGGGGGGAYARSTNVTLPPGSYEVFVGAGGAPGLTGGASNFADLVIAVGGSSSMGDNGAAGGLAADCIFNDIAYSGGKGGATSGPPRLAGGGGGASAKPTADGEDGFPGVGSMGGGGGGGPMGTEPGHGGKGGDEGFNGDFGIAPGGGGGGSGKGNGTFGGSGAEGRVIVKVDQILPIRLAYFVGKRVAEGIELNWQTVLEENNDYMALERSADGIDFREIGRVKGVGSTTEPQYYTYLDATPKSGSNYYRLRQVDLDGTEEYHPVIYVDFADPSTSLKLQVFPNPGTEHIRVSWPVDKKQEAVIRIFNLSGQQLATYRIPGEHATFEFPVNDLAAGMYNIVLTRGSSQESVRFVKE